MSVLCLLAALAFAPVARAVCDLQHVSATAHQQPSCHDEPRQDTGSGQGGACCDGALATMSQMSGAVSEAGAAHASTPALVAVVPMALRPVAPRLVAGVPRSRSPAPFEPILLRLPRRLI